MANIAKITARQWQHYQTGLKLDNPIQIGLRYLQVFQDQSVQTFAQAAEILGVTRERVYQMTALVTKLPGEIKDYLAGSKDPDILGFFTERRLRPLTTLPNDKAKLKCLKDMMEQASIPAS